MTDLKAQPTITTPRNWVRLIAFTLICLSLACSLPKIGKPDPGEATQAAATPTIPPTPTPTPQPLPPALIESDPPIGGELPLQGPITLYFNQEMDQTSVEASLYGQIEAQTTFTWPNDRTVELFFASPLQPESALDMSLGAESHSAQGLGLIQPVNIHYNTTGYLRLAQKLPEPDAVDVNPSSAIVAAFTRPVVPLGAEPLTLPPAFTLDPPAQGRGEWINTSTYIFYPSPALEGGKPYQVNIDPGLKSTAGGPLQEAGSWGFTTAYPRLLSMEPLTETLWDLDAAPTLTFNQPMNTSSVAANFSLLGPDGAPVAGSGEWNEDNSQYTFTPANLLRRDSAYSLRLNGTAQAQGGTPLGGDFFATITTYPALSVYQTNPVPGGQLGSHSGLFIYFSAPIQHQDVIDHIHISPKVSNLNSWFNEGELSLSIGGNFAPSTDYLLTISPDLPDPWGGVLGQEYQLLFSSAPAAPSLSLATPSDAVFIRSTGSSLTAQATNIFNTPTRLGSVPLQDFIAMQGPNGYEIIDSYRSFDQISWQQSLDVPVNTNTVVPVYFTPDHAPLPTGMYLLRLDLETFRANTRSKLLVVSDIQMTLKASATDALVWAVDLRDNQALPAAPVTLYDEEGNLLASGQTDAQGLFYTTYPAVEDPYRVIFAVIGQPGQANFGLASSSWSAGIQPWDFQLPFRSLAPGLKVYLYTDRPIYRPGQTIYFRAVARQAYNGRYELPELSQLPITLSGDQGDLLNIELPLSAFGTAHGEYAIPADAQPGYYVLRSPDARQTGGISLQIANYRKPEINLQVGFEADEIQAGEMIKATVNARYFFDAPAGNVDIEWALYKADAHFSLPGYRVGPEDTGWLLAFQMPNYGAFGELVDEGQGKTAPDGTLALEFATDNGEGQARYSLEITAQDESGLPISARAEINVHPADFYIGVRPDSWVGKAGQAAGFEVLVVDWERAPAGQHSLSADFSKVVWERREPDEGEEYLGPKFVPTYTPVASTDFTTSPEGQARLSFTPPEAGTYQLDIYDPSAPPGSQTRTEMVLWVSGPTRATWPSIPNARIKLNADRDSYQSGEMAQVFIPNPFGQAVPALMTIERSIIMEHRLIEIEAGGTTLAIPLTGEHAPNVFVSVTLLGADEAGESDFRQGFVELTVEPVAQILNVQLTSRPERAGPGDQVQFEVLVTDASGDPVQGQFSLSVVDLAVLALAEPNSPEIGPSFYGRQPSGVRTALSLAASADRLIYHPLGLGGGGGGDIPSVVREDFPDTAYWNAEIETGADGKAQVTLNLPDTLTTWQVEMRGLTLDTRVGDAQSEVVTSKDLLVRPVTPRFLAAGDRVLLAAILQNNSAETIQAEAGLQASGVALEDAGLRQVSILPGQRARVEWWALALDEDSADLVFSVRGSGDSGSSYSDAARPAMGALPIVRYSARQAFRTAGVLDTAGEIIELVSLPASFDPGGGALNIELAPSLASSMLGALEMLEASPYESTEGAISRFLPNLETFRTLTDFGIQNDAMAADLESSVNQSLVKLAADQNEDGGWGWWANSRSDPYISAYALLGMNRAQVAGFSIDPERVQRALDYLLEFQYPGPEAQKWELDRLAFAQYVLAGYESMHADTVAGLFERRAELSPWARALVALSMEELTPGNQESKTLMGEIGSAAIRSASGAFWEFSQDEAGLLAAQMNMHTDLSNSAVVIFALAQRDPGAPLLADAVRYLMANRSAQGSWASTYGTAWSLMAINKVMAGTGELGGDFSFAATLNHGPLVEGQAGGAGQLTPAVAQAPIQVLYPDYPNALRIRRDEGQGRLYYNVGLLVSQPAGQIAPLSQGLSIERAFYPTGEACTDDKCPATRSAQTGERLTVRLTLSLPHDMHYLVVEDFIPAGAEILDTRLKTSQQGEYEEPQEVVLFDPRRPFAQGWGWWLFNDSKIYDDHITWTADYLPAGTYQLTYTLVILQPGQFQVLPARAWQFYFPDVQANSAGEVFEIKQ